MRDIERILERVIAAHGGADLWRGLGGIEAELSADGFLFTPSGVRPCAMSASGPAPASPISSSTTSRAPACVASCWAMPRCASWLRTAPWRRGASGLARPFAACAGRPPAAPRLHGGSRRQLGARRPSVRRLPRLRRPPDALPSPRAAAFRRPDAGALADPGGDRYPRPAAASGGAHVMALTGSTCSVPTNGVKASCGLRSPPDATLPPLKRSCRCPSLVGMARPAGHSGQEQKPAG